MIDAYAVTREFEAALCKYSGAKYAVCVNSCTAAILLTCKWFAPTEIRIPAKTYCSVPMAIISAGHRVRFDNRSWHGEYWLGGIPVLDSARRFTSGMHYPNTYRCVSFSSSKILGIEQGGAILHDDNEADPWFRRMRFDGRTEGKTTLEDEFKEIGHHMIMLPSISAQLLLKLSFLPKDNADLPMIEYPDLSLHKAFQ